jgi:hypothetical protein
MAIFKNSPLLCALKLTLDDFRSEFHPTQISSQLVFPKFYQLMINRC